VGLERKSMTDFLININWRQPLWLLLMLQPLLLWLALRWLQSRKQQHFADEHLLPWIRVPKNQSIWQRIFSRDTAYFLAWLGFALALAGPRISDNKNPDPSQSKLDIMLVIDLSRSMYATDIKPSRLRRATLEAYELLSIAASSKQQARIGIIVYAARPHLLVPLTTDFNALEFYLRDLDTLQMPTQGSNPTSAIILAQKELAKSNSDSVSQNIIWLTDGDLSQSSTDQLNHLKEAIQLSPIKTYLLALASTEGAAIPLTNGTWLESEGQAVISKPNFKQLELMLKSGGGAMSMVEDNESDWNRIYQQGILTSTLQTQDSNDNEQWQELYGWFLLPAIVLLFIALFPGIKALLIILVLTSIVAISKANADEAFIENTFEGVRGYVNKQYNLARSKFIQSVLTADTEKQRANALHNLGNALFQNGDYDGASKLFADALRYNPNQEQSFSNQKLSIELNQILQRRLRNARRQGNLATPGQISMLVDLPAQLPERLNTRAVNVSEFKLPELPKKELNRLLEKGLAHIKLLQSDTTSSKAAIQQKQNVDEARLYLIGLQEQGSRSSNALWKRLFEIEEGFPGKLKKSKEIPGVQPW